MPIRLNLLAEAQAAEELRRRDPVKRAIWIGVVIIAVMLCWSTWVQCKVTLASSQVNKLQNQLVARTNEYQTILTHEAQGGEIKRKLEALKKLSSVRLLNGNLLNALQQTTVPDVQLMRITMDQSFVLTAEVKSQTVDNRKIPGKPATATEKAILTIDASDTSANPGDQVTKFKDVIACNTYFKDSLVATNPINLKSLSPQQLAPGSGLPCVLFSIQCRYPDHLR
jgi:hypothetical protein